MRVEYALEDVFWAMALFVVEQESQETNECEVPNNNTFLTGKVILSEMDKGFRVNAGLDELQNMEQLIWGTDMRTIAVRRYVGE